MSSRPLIIRFVVEPHCPWCFIMYKSLVVAAENVGVSIVFKWEPFLCINEPNGVNMSDYVKTKWGEESLKECKGLLYLFVITFVHCLYCYYSYNLSYSS